MPDPIPKAAGQRRRRNKTVGETQVALRRAAKPPCPVDSDAARAWWDRQWDSDLAKVWLEVDVPAIERLVMLIESLKGGVNGAILSEIRQLEDRFGLSPLSRRRLQWEVEQAGESEPDAPVEQDARWLRVVSN